jgi:hypothetical protein
MGNEPISTAPAVDPAIIERKALGLSFFFSGTLSCCAVAIVESVVVVLLGLGNFGSDDGDRNGSRAAA